MTTESLKHLDTRLRALARHDTDRRIFGASMHSWQSWQLPPEEVDAVREHTGAAALPNAWLWWTSEGPGVGPGPFYGLQHPVDVPAGEGPLAGALPLSDHGCGYADWLLTSGPHAGEVWVDFREGGGELQPWYASFEAWMDAWISRAHADWGIAYLEDAVPPNLESAFLSDVEAALLRAIGRPNDPMLLQYPLPLDKAHGALGTIALARGDMAAAETAFETAASLSREPDAWRALGECRVASAKRDAGALLAAADRGPQCKPLWWLTQGQLLVHRMNALEGLARWDEGVAARQAVADHFNNDVRKQLDLVWVRMLRRETDLAAARIRDLATRGLGCDAAAPMAERIAQVSGGLVEALRREGFTDRADALEAALRES